MKHNTYQVKKSKLDIGDVLEAVKVGRYPVSVKKSKIFFKNTIQFFVLCYCTRISLYNYSYT